jgi:hypothetical protein
MTPVNSSRSTDALIDYYVSQLRPTSTWAMPRRLAAGVGVGGIISAILLITLIGARPNLAEVAASGSFWGKVAFILATAVASLFVAARLGRPGAPKSLLWILPVPFLAYLPVAAWELARTDPAQWAPLLLGHGWKQCTWLVLILSLPVFVGLWWSFRKFAPTHIEAAGAVAGLSASAVAGLIYCIHCPTDTAVFALVWYTLAFALASLTGAIFGRRLLRW